MKITLVRHGQTDDNFNGIMQGRRNVLMNDTGRRQCQMLRMKLDKEHFDYCYMSPLTRTVETAMILIGDKVEMIPDQRIIEREMGELDGGPRENYNAYKYWNYDLNCDDRGVEPVQDIFKRCEDFLNYLKDKYTDESILIVTHQAPYRALRLLIKGKELKGNLIDSMINNCSCESFEVE